MVPDSSSSPLRVTVDVVALTLRDEELLALAVRRAEPPYRGRWALPGRPVAVDEAVDASAERVLSEVARVGPGEVRLEQLATYGDPGRDPRGRTISVAHLCVLPHAPDPQAAASWRPVDTLLGRGRLAFDHRAVLADGVERVRARLEHTGLATAFLEPEFTIADLRAVYEVVWGHPLDAGNFHRKVTRTEGFVTATGRRRSVGRGRPAELFRAGPEETLHPPLTRRSLHGG